MILLVRLDISVVDQRQDQLLSASFQPKINNFVELFSVLFFLLNQLTSRGSARPCNFFPKP
jgi:hypothetical protein